MLGSHGASAARRRAVRGTTPQVVWRLWGARQAYRLLSTASGGAVDATTVNCHGEGPPRRRTQAGCVPGATRRRDWFALEHWCALCCEPQLDTNIHLGKRDHICLSLVYDAIVHVERRWEARAVCTDLTRWLGQAARGGRHRRRHRRDYRAPMDDLGPPCTSPLLSFYAAHELNEPAARRRELLLCLQYLRAHGLLTLRPASFGKMAREGVRVLLSSLVACVMQVFPLAQARHISGIMQMTTTIFNAETVFTLCHLDLLVTTELASSRGVVGRSVASAPCAVSAVAGTAGDGAALVGGGDMDEGRQETVGDVMTEDDLTILFRANFALAVLGLLRWALEPDTVAPPPCAAAAAAVTVNRVIAAHAERLLLSEFLHCKLHEYVVRAEPVFFDDEDRSGPTEAALYRHLNSSVYLDAKTPARGRGRAAASSAMRVAAADYARGKPEVVPPAANWGAWHAMDYGYLFHRNLQPHNVGHIGDPVSW